MDDSGQRLKKIFDLLALVSAVLALGMLLLWKAGPLQVITFQELNTYVSNLAAVYCISYGLSLWIQNRNKGFALGLLAISIAIIVANLIAMKF